MKNSRISLPRLAAAALACALLAGCAGTRPPFPSREHALTSMMDSEALFAQSLERAGGRAAYLRFLDDDALVFRPEPVSARRWWEGQPDGPAARTRDPLHAYAYVAASGDLGFVLGPYAARPGAPAERGLYVDVWRREGERWLLAAEMEVPEGAAPTPPFPRWRPPASYDTPVERMNASPGRVRRTLLKADSVFGQWAGMQSLGEAVSRFSDDSVRLLHPRVPLAKGLSEIQAHPAAGAKLPSFPDDAEVSRAGDFGWVRGRFYVPRASGGYQATGSYLRVWRRAFRGDWRLILEVTTEAGPAA